MNRVLRPLTAFVMFAGVYAMAVVVGRVSRIAGSEVALVWPAAAIAVISSSTKPTSGGFSS
ncbi:hypothetical protein [Mycobacteroides abscessus]|uniref:hypothetical protein n=1 Tax=Mycobacteroides abscessus TaxID=36809 RepID=UPI0018784B84